MKKEPKYEVNKIFIDAVDGLISQKEWRLLLRVIAVHFHTILLLKAKLRYTRRHARVDKMSKALAEDLSIFAFKQEVHVLSDYDPTVEN